MRTWTGPSCDERAATLGLQDLLVEIEREIEGVRSDHSPAPIRIASPRAVTMRPPLRRPLSSSPREIGSQSTDCSATMGACPLIGCVSNR